MASHFFNKIPNWAIFVTNVQIRFFLFIYFWRNQIVFMYFPREIHVYIKKNMC